MLETAVVAARLAGQKACELLDYVKSYLKNGTEYVTRADVECQESIVNRIKQVYPDHGFLAEEGPEGGIFKQPPRGAEPIWWIIDPIDGTANFVHGIPCFTISVAAVYEDRPVVGAVFDPSTDSMFTAVAGGEAQLNGRRIGPGREGLSQLASVGLDSYYNEGVPEWVNHVIQHTRSRNFGTTALHLAYVARGSLAAAAAARAKLWDIAAGVLIAQTAGAIATDWKGGELFPLDVGSYDRQEICTLAGNKKAYNQLKELIR
jgi:myo-inositol-1(or 4)-monophosphatase